MKKKKKTQKPLTGQVRLARMADIFQIYKVIRENPKEVLPRSYQDLFRNFDRFLVYDEKEKIKGVISWQVLPGPIPDEDKALEVVSFSVRKRDQGRGIGSRLLNQMLKRLIKYHPDRILVLTFYPKFFKKFGFRRVSKKKLYSKIFLGCINCTKYPSPLNCPEVPMEIRLSAEKKEEEKK